jgi:hypothetical protein
MKPETVELLLKIISDRANWWTEKAIQLRAQPDKGVLYGDAMGEMSAYQNVESILMYALNDDLEALCQFDYYGKEKEN